VKRLALNTIIFLVLSFLLVPILIIIPLSFNATQYLQFPPTEFSLQWYDRFFGRAEWMASLRLSFFVAVLSTAMTLLLGVPASLALVRGRFRGKGLVYALVLSPMIVPTIITALALYLFFVRFGAVGNAFAMALGHTVLALPLMVIIVSATLQGFDQRLEQAAASLGATPIQAFSRITLPLIAPGVISGGLFSFLSSFDELVVALFLSGTTTLTLPVRIWNSIFLQVEPTIAAVSSFLIGVALLTIFLAQLLQRMWVK
jgi:putative spermidine/putrescine transport system permease protein